MHMKRGQVKKSVHSAPHVKHSPFFYLWELITLACVVFVAEAWIGHPFIHVDEKTEHLLELAVHGAEAILIADVALLILIARNKVHYVNKNWLNIAAVLPFGGSLRVIQGLKVGWHAFEKTKAGHFLEHPLEDSRRWFRKNLGLRV